MAGQFSFSNSTPRGKSRDPRATKEAAAVTRETVKVVERHQTDDGLVTIRKAEAFAGLVVVKASYQVVRGEGDTETVESVPTLAEARSQAGVAERLKAAAQAAAQAKVKPAPVATGKRK